MSNGFSFFPSSRLEENSNSHPTPRMDMNTSISSSLKKIYTCKISSKYCYAWRRIETESAIFLFKFFSIPPSLHRISSNRTMYFFLFVNPKPWYPQKNQRFKFYRWRIVVNCQRIWGRTLFTLSNNLMKSSNRKVNKKGVSVNTQQSVLVKTLWKVWRKKSSERNAPQSMDGEKNKKSSLSFYMFVSVFVQVVSICANASIRQLVFIGASHVWHLLNDTENFNFDRLIFFKSPKWTRKRTAMVVLLLLLLRNWHNLQCGFVLYVFMCAAK